MSKAFSKRYHFASPSTTSIRGSMICAKCRKPIDDKTQDWMSAQKTIKHGHDWYYICYHRSCVDNQNGWVKIEQKKLLFDERVKEMVNLLKPYFDSSEYSDALYQAGIDIGLIDN